MAEFALSQLAGMLIGIVTSFFSWWLLFHRIRPQIEFSPSIGRMPNDRSSQDDQSDHKYRFKVENGGRRTIVDVNVRARLFVKGLSAARTWEVVDIPLENGSLEYFVPLIEPARSGGRRTILRFLLNEVPAFEKVPFPEHIRSKASHRTLLLEDLLGLGSQAELRVYVSGSDVFCPRPN